MALTRAAVVACLVALLCLSGTVLLWMMTPDRARDASETESVDPREMATVEVVRGWDAQRSRAWAAGSITDLAQLYVDGARTGRQDATMLQTYVDRGLVVEGLDVQLIAVEEVRRSDTELVVDVTDRVHAGTVVGAEVARTLPRDGADTRRIVFRLIDEQWRVQRVAERSVG